MSELNSGAGGGRGGAAAKRRRVAGGGGGGGAGRARDEDAGASVLSGGEGEHDSEGSGEDLMENMADDYRDMGQLDAYDSQMLDDRSYDDNDPDARRAAEAALEQRDRRERRRAGGRLGAAFESEEGA